MDYPLVVQKLLNIVIMVGRYHKEIVTELQKMLV